jgi:DNA-binding NarL/FixJ family response regulator
MAITLVLADDHPVVLTGLERLLKPERGIVVKAACQNGEDALQAVREHSPDFLILDLGMAGLDGLGVLRVLSRERRSTRVIVLTASVDGDEVLEARRLGAAAVILKDAASRDIVEVIRGLGSGEYESSRRITAHALRVAAAPADTLTAAEMQIVRLVAIGLPNLKIAEQLHVTEGTVKFHLHNIYTKLGLDGRGGLMAYAREKLL